MEQASSSVRYSTPTKIFHWVTAVLVLIAFIYGPGGSEQRVYSAARDFDRQLHESLGLCIFALVVARVLWRPFDKRPEPPNVPRWMRVTAGGVQAALYVLLFALPLTAISGAWLEAHPLTLLGGVTIPSPLPESHALGAGIAAIHGWLGDTIMWLAGAHACAALFHQYVLKDGVLRAMLPQRGSSRELKRPA